MGSEAADVTTERTGPTHGVRRELYSVFCVIPRTATHARKINDERGGLRTREGTRGPGSHSQRMPVAGEDLGAQDPGPSALSRTPGPPHGAAEVAFSSRPDPGSAEVLECPPRSPSPPPPQGPDPHPLQEHVVSRHLHTSRDEHLTTHKAARLSRLHERWARVSGGGGRRGCLPSPADSTLLGLARSGGR